MMKVDGGNLPEAILETIGRLRVAGNGMKPFPIGWTVHLIHARCEVSQALRAIKDAEEFVKP